jgi:hypothetical protein
MAALAAAVSQAAPGAKPGTGPDRDPDLSGKIVYVVTKPKDAKSGCGYGLYEHVRVVRLGDRAFLVGDVPDYGEDAPEYKAAVGKRVWTPVSDLVQMSEFDSVAEARQYFDAGRKHADKDDK